MRAWLRQALSGLSGLSLCLLAACASLPAPVFTGGAADGSFALEGRFSLRIERYGEAPQAAAGKLDWRHAPASDRLLLLSPLGSGVAELVREGRRAKLTLAGGEVRESPNADQLLYQATGYALPVGRLAGWLRGRGEPGANLERDPAGRPLRLVDQGWRIEYGYAGEQADEWPVRLTVVRENEMELRLRIDQWRGLDD